MTGSAVRSVGGASRGWGGVEAPPARHLRVLPPVPAAYAVPPGRRAPVRDGAAAPAVAPRGSSHLDGRPGVAPPPLRLTARGRRLVVVLAVALVVGLVALGEAVMGGGDGLELMGTASVVVEPGDTLWSVAGGVAGDRDVREVVDEIQTLNGLRSADLVPGQVLALP